MKTYISLIIGLLLMSLGTLQAQSVGSAAPDFSLSSIDGSTFTLSENKDKVVFIFLFGNSCGHCIDNGPNTESGIYQLYKNNPNVVCVGVDVWDGNTAQVQSYKASTGVTYPLLLKGSSLKSKYSTTYDRMIVVDQQGIIRYKSTSNASAAVVSQAKSVMDGLLQTAVLSERPAQSSLNAFYDADAQLLRFKPLSDLGAGVTLRVMNMAGQLVHQQAWQIRDDNSVPIALPQRGLYVMTLSSPGSTLVAKIANY